MPGDAAPGAVRVVFVCTGNICRSPMAEVMARRAFEEAGLADRVTVSSVGTGGWHVGDGMDPRAAAELERHGYASAHTAAQLADDDHTAHLLVALDRGHRAHLHHAGVEPDRVRLLRSFDPDAHGEDVADPYYGDHTDFTRTRVEITAALPGLVDEVRDLLG
ncbi:MAG TPA: low molecular weight phosphotyrosine protein phosphatase [Actinomycetales bacterium]|nr:low molecular weight phosphotyrosine protein phosphatase [Actinomycetales bacterium]